MTIASEEYRSGPYTGNGVTTAFPYDFRILNETHLRVIRTQAGVETVLTLGDYTVSDVGNEGGGSITMNAAPTAAQTITITRNVPFTQEIDLENQGAYFAETIEGGLDLSVMRDQQLSERLDRAVMVPASSPDYDPDQLVNDILNVKSDREATEAARDAAQAAASALANQAHQYDTRALAAGATIPAGVNVIRTYGLAVAGDGGGAEYVRGAASSPGAFQDATGAYWGFASVPGAVVHMDTRTRAAAASFAANVNVVVTHGDATYGDGGGATYKRGTSAGPGAFQDAKGVYWEWANPSISRDVGYRQSEAGAVAAPLIRRLSNTLFASEFGAVGDNATNDYAALQAFLNAVGLTGKEGRFDPGKRYFVSGGDLLFRAGANSSVQNTGLYGMGAQIRTDPTQFRTGLTIQHQTALTRLDETRKVIVEGLRISQFQDANAVWGFQVIGSPHVTLRDCTVLSGSDSATVPQANYAAFYFKQSDANNPDTGSFWCRMEDCTVKGAATACPVAIRLDGQCNAMVIRGCDTANSNDHILLARQNVAANSATAQVANGVRVMDCDFEGGQNCIRTVGVAGFSTLAGLVVMGCRAEAITQAFFNYTLNVNPLAGTAPYISDKTNVRIGVAQFINNPNALTVNTTGA